MSEEDKNKQIQVLRVTDDKLAAVIKQAAAELHVQMKSRDQVIDFLASRYLAEAA